MLKKILSALLISVCVSSAFADSSATNIKIRVNGALHDNRYFLCLPNVGCLSILNGQHGKVFPVYHAVNVDGIYVADVMHNLEVTGQGLPTSCDTTVDPGKTLTITGTITPSQNGHAQINNLHCSVS